MAQKHKGKSFWQFGYANEKPKLLPLSESTLLKETSPMLRLQSKIYDKNESSICKIVKKEKRQLC